MPIKIYPKWKRGKKNNLKNLPISNGNVLVTTDTEELYIDIDGKRLNIGKNNIIQLTEEEILNTTNPENMLYLATDVGKIYYYNEGWKFISGGNSGDDDSSKGSGIVFEIRDDGCLYMICEDENDIDKFYINDNGCLIYKLQDAELTEVNLGKVVGSIPSMSGATNNATGTGGLVPAPGVGDQNKYLRGDGTWQTPPDTNTTYDDMTGATSDNDGTSGLVPAPAAGDQDKFLKGDGTWETPHDTTYDVATDETDGLMSSEDKTTLSTIHDNMAGLRFGQDEEGKWGYIAPGADTVTPFKTGDSGGSNETEVKVAQYDTKFTRLLDSLTILSTYTVIKKEECEFQLKTNGFTQETKSLEVI